jgi:hypothetical protein
MQLQEFLNAVKQMRDHQKAYFKERKQSDLIASKEFEGVVDRGLKEGVTVTTPTSIPLGEGEERQGNLFTGDEQ